MAGALSGIRVVEFTGLGPAPLAGQLLADLGATVIAVDRKSLPADPHDINRRGKSSLAVDLKTAEGREAVKRLLQTADILIEGFRPGVMEKLGFGPDDVPERIIYGRMTGWGQTGPRAHTAGHDITYLATTGVLNMIGKPGEPPVPPLNLAADFGGGTMFLIMGILAALYERERSGKGQVIDAAMVDGVPAMMGIFAAFAAKGMLEMERGRNFLDGSAPWYRCYETADGQYIAAGPIEPQFFSEFLRLGGLPEEDAAHRNDRSCWPDMIARYEAHFKTRTRDEWAAVFSGSDACVAPVLTDGEAASDRHMAARNIFLDVDGVRHPHPAPRLSRTPGPAPAASGAPGADSRAILRDIGYSEDEISALRRSGVLT